MKEYLSNRLFILGLMIVVLGSAPLLAILALARIGIWPDPDPNPIGPGLLTFVTFWPGILLMFIGARQVNTQHRGQVR